MEIRRLQAGKALPKANGGRSKYGRNTAKAKTEQGTHEAQGMKEFSITATERKRDKSERHFKGRNEKNRRQLEFRH